MLMDDKKKQLELCVEIFNMPGVYLTDFTGLNVEEISDLRQRLREEGVKYTVVKNTLARRAAEETGLNGVLDHLVKPTGIAYSDVDAVLPARVIVDFHKKTKKLEIKCGILDGQIYDGERVMKEIAILPSRLELQTKLAVALNANIVSFASALYNMLSGLVTVINAVKEKREKISPDEDSGSTEEASEKKAQTEEVSAVEAASSSDTADKDVSDDPEKALTEKSSDKEPDVSESGPSEEASD